PASAPAPAPVAGAAPAVDADAVRTLADNLLRLSGYGSDESFFKRRLREFVADHRGADGDTA
ncbi:MAG TPA: hypothetical protein VFH88_00890, partial [Candidatus Krumholzibacteria bacterium]|nr:hypothetical protein [Candidatus Krumholzibacteria bacterium]